MSPRGCLAEEKKGSQRGRGEVSKGECGRESTKAMGLLEELTVTYWAKYKTPIHRGHHQCAPPKRVCSWNPPRNCARRIFWPLEGADSPPAPSARAGASKPPGQGRRAAEAGVQAPGPPARPPRSLRADAPRRSLETQTACHHAAVLRLQKDGLRTSTNNLTSQAVAFVLFSLDPVPHRPLTHSCQPPRCGKAPGQRGQSPGNATRLTCAPGSRQAGLRWRAGGGGRDPLPGCPYPGAQHRWGAKLLWLATALPGKAGSEQAPGQLRKPTGVRGARPIPRLRSPSPSSRRPCCLLYSSGAGHFSALK
ncbi:uncharacterized protein [Sagmatias obliquidens]|uniref:uncharacterized protein n=1 Tax=Sagmatias obliquidens TaxID=3371155 RepID=UPI000F445E24|nr:uncharacterized protein LOC113629836 [Lagenorhynchus obliquidens]